MARETRSRDKKDEENPSTSSAAAAATPGTSLTVTLSNPLGKKRKRRSSTAATLPTNAEAAQLTGAAGMTKGDRLLGAETREAITLLLENMRLSMPVNTPARDVLTLALPPSFAATPENTLSQHLQSHKLTRTALVATLSSLATHLLKHTTPSPFRKEPANAAALEEDQKAIYSLFRSVHNVLEALPATTSSIATATVGTARIPIKPAKDRRPTHPTSFALQQTIPINGQSGEWFSSAIGKAQADELAATATSETSTEDTPKGEEGGDGSEAAEDLMGLTKVVMSDSNLLSNAIPVPIHDTLAPVASTSAIPETSLGDSVYQKASLNVEKFKSQRALRRKRLFGAVTHTVDMTSQSRTSWQPSFGMTHDSSSASGGWGYMSSCDMGYRNGAWDSMSREQWGSRVDEGAIRGERGVGTTVEDVDMETPDRDAVSELLTANEKRLRELGEWQTTRVRRGDPRWVSDREASVAREVLETLSVLASSAPPSALVPPGLNASALASAIIQTRAPHIRGTLDPKRPRAIADDGTLRLLPRSQIVPTNQIPQQRFTPAPIPRSSTPQQYAPAARPQQLSQHYGQQPQRVSTPQSQSTPYSSYGRSNNFPQTPLQRTSLPHTPQPYGRPIHSAATPAAARPVVPLAAATQHQAQGSQLR